MSVPPARSPEMARLRNGLVGVGWSEEEAYQLASGPAETAGGDWSQLAAVADDANETLDLPEDVSRAVALAAKVAASLDGDPFAMAQTALALLGIAQTTAAQSDQAGLGDLLGSLLDPLTTIIDTTDG